MTRNEIIEMARKSDIDWHSQFSHGEKNRLEVFAALVVAHEREECAKVFESLDELELYAQDIAAAFYKSASDIRARGNA